MEVLKLDPGAIKKTDWLKTRDELLNELVDVESVDSEIDLKITGALQTRSAKHLKALDKIRMAAKRPALDYNKEIDAQAKEMIVELKEQMERIKKLNGDFATKLTAKAEAERQRIAAEAAEKAAKEQAAPSFGGINLTAPTDAEPTHVAQLPEVKVSTGVNAMVKVWEFQVINEREIPREFLSVDQKKIREFMNYKVKIGEKPELTGVQFSTRIDVRSR